MNKLNLTDVKSGLLIDEIREATVTFWHKAEQLSVDIRYKQLPFAETESLLTRLNNKEPVAAEWISKALVDEKGKQMFTQQQVEQKFVQSLANAVFEQLMGVEELKKAMNPKGFKTPKR